MITVYADVMFAVNFLMDLLLLNITADICRKTNKIRVIIGAFIGAAYSVLIFFADISFTVSLILNISVSAFMLLAACGYGGRKAFLKTAGVFGGASLFLGGICFTLFMRGKAFTVNGTVYFDESVRRLILGCAAAYYAVKLLRRIIEKTVITSGGYVKVKISLGKNNAEFTAFNDTGNLLTEPLSGLPVCITGRKIFSRLTEGEAPQLYIIPYKTVEKPVGALIGVKPEKVYITEKDGETYETKCVVAAADIKIGGEAEGLVSPMMTNYRKDLTLK